MSSNNTENMNERNYYRTENHQLNPDGSSNRRKSSGPNQLNVLFYVGVIIESDARSNGVQLKRGAMLFTVIGLITKHVANTFVI